MPLELSRSLAVTAEVQHDDVWLDGGSVGERRVCVAVGDVETSSGEMLDVVFEARTVVDQKNLRGRAAGRAHRNRLSAVRGPRSRTTNLGGRAAAALMRLEAVALRDQQAGRTQESSFKYTADGGGAPLLHRHCLLLRTELEGQMKRDQADRGARTTQSENAASPPAEDLQAGDEGIDDTPKRSDAPHLRNTKDESPQQSNRDED